MINHNLLLPLGPVRGLPDIRSYLAEDTSSLNLAPRVYTPFGEMAQLEKGGYFRRHVRDQTHVAMGALALTNLRLGKIPVIDCMTIRQIQDGTVRRFMEESAFDPYPKCLIHFVTSEEECYRRLTERALADKAAAARDRAKLASRETFHRHITEEQPMLPPELTSYNHLLVDTSRKTPQECALECLRYITA